MYGFDIEIDDITLEPQEIDGTVYVPYHVKNGNQEVTAFVDAELVEGMFDGGDDDLGTDDFRYDP